MNLATAGRKRHLGRAPSEFAPMHSMPGLSALVLLTGCAYPLPNPPTSMQPLGTILINHAPESANGLPPGAQVLAPLTEVVGQLNTVRVGPP